MTEDKPLKSAYELAMERFKKSDADAGVVRQPPTDAQKAEIAEVRSLYQAKIAELEILHQGRMRKTLDPAEQATLAEEHRRENERLASQREDKIEKIRRATDPAR